MSDVKRILIVDDEPSILEIVEILLSSEGYQVLKASNGQEGLDIAKQYLPDAIILDVMMPKMSGYMVATLLSSDSKLKKIPVMLLTATAQIAGNITLEIPTPYKLSKPFKPEELLDLLTTMLEETAA
ncbi:response regulator [bacterium]|jgi:two-component system, OmpR family, alkaline phosphatase synthesis response regulator PhoP|nr:response regulator [bacterium]